MLCTKLRECRELCAYSQQQVAECLNIDRSTYSYYESGRTEPSIENLKRIAKLFGVRISELLEIDDDDVKYAQSGLRDPGSENIPGAFAEYDREEDTKLNNRIGNKVGDLSREEQRLIMRFRMLTDNQRRDIMLAMALYDSEPDDLQQDNY